MPYARVITAHIPQPAPLPVVPARPAGRLADARPADADLMEALNEEWARVCASAEAADALSRWTARPGWACMTGAADLGGLAMIVEYVQHVDRTLGERDEVLLHLLTLCQEGDRLAGRVVLQVMLPKAIRLALGLTRHPSWTDGAGEARATVVAALWGAIASYRLEDRPARVTANLALDTLAAVTRRRRAGVVVGQLPRVVVEELCGDVRVLADPGYDATTGDDLTGPADAELCTLLAWGVRTGALRLPEAQLLIRAYGIDGQADPAAGPVTIDAVATELGLRADVLRQRCHRLARRLGRAAVAAGIGSSAPATGSVLLAA